MPPRRKALPGKSRLGPGKVEPTISNGQGILQFFDSKKKVSVHEAGAGGVSPAVTGRAGAIDGGTSDAIAGGTVSHPQKENIALEEGHERAQALMASDVVREKQVAVQAKTGHHVRKGNVEESKAGVDAKGALRRLKRNTKDSTHVELILEEEYGVCSSQDILLGNTDGVGNMDALGGRVVWTASPGKGVLSTEDAFDPGNSQHCHGASPGSTEDASRAKGRHSRQRMGKIEPVLLCGVVEGVEGEPDVFDALSTALNNTVPTGKRRESLGAHGTPQAAIDVKGTLGALKQCCNDLQFKESPESSRKKKRVRRRSTKSGAGRSADGGDCGRVSKGVVVVNGAQTSEIIESRRDVSKRVAGGAARLCGEVANGEAHVPPGRTEADLGLEGRVVHEVGTASAAETTETNPENVQTVKTLRWGDTDSEEEHIDDGLDLLLDGLDRMTQSVATFSTMEMVGNVGVDSFKHGVPAHLLARHVIISCGSDGRWPVVVLRRGDGRVVHAHLQSPWDSGNYRPGDAVNLIKPQEYLVGEETHCELGMGRPGFLVQFPELLLGSTRVTSSSECPRRGYLQEKIVSGDGGSCAAAIYGQMYHQLIQSAMLRGYRKGSELSAEIDSIVDSMPEALLDAHISTEEAVAWLKEKVPVTLSFLNKFLRCNPTGVNSCQVVASSGAGQQSVQSCISRVEEVEDYFVSPTYGLKGYIDVTTSLKSVVNSTLPNFTEAARSLSSLGPFEIKTGTPRPSDTAQVLLYLLALEEKYGTDVPYGMLYYLKEREPTVVERNDALISCLLATRNTVAASLARTELPPMTHMKTSCLRCWDRSTCALVHASRSCGTAEQFVEGLPKGTAEYTRLKEFYELEVGHLNNDDKEFLAEWDRLLDLEAIASNASRGEIWTMPATERERIGRCVASLKLCSSKVADFATRGNNHVNTRGMVYTFVKHGGRKILGSSITFGEPVLLSIEGGPLGVSKGHVISTNREEIVVHTDKPIRTKCLERRASPGLRGRPLVELDLTWKIDKEEVGTTVPRMRGFLYDLFGYMDHPEINARRQSLRRLIVGLEHPGVPSAVEQLREVERDAISYQSRELSMNREQEQALICAFSQPGYSLVLGVPGAGKTTAIVGMIKALAAVGKRVLLVSYTNAAVDHVMIKLISGGFGNFLRLGRPGRVNGRLVEFLPTGDRYQASTATDMCNIMARIPVVGVSALGVTDTLLRQCNFDVCIVDEAGQITLPSVMGALLRADKFILVGDHNQLPPLVQSAAAEEQGLDTPLFARLAKAHPSTVVTLSRQYRMSEEIQSISNAFVYGGALQCGTEDVAKARLSVDRAALKALQSVDPWMHRVLTPDSPLLFIDTSGLPHRFTELSNGEITENHGEADLAIAIADAAVRLNVPGDSVAIISPYRSQVSLINDKIRTRNNADSVQGGDVDVLKGNPGLPTSFECLTIDKAQGRDKAMVIVSLVKSNDRQDPGKLLSDLRRVNVAVTRAQCKLVLIGDSSTLVKLDLFSGIIRFMRGKKWITSVAM